MAANDVTFAKQIGGYDRNEVDNYIKNLSQAYHTAYSEYNTVCATYNDLLSEYTALCRQREQNKSNIAVIAKTLIETEALANKIIEDARSEAEIIKSDTQETARKIKEDAYIERASAKIQIQKLIDEANTEIAKTRERAREIIKDAQTDAALINMNARRNLEQTNESIAVLVKDLQELLPLEMNKLQMIREREVPAVVPLRSAGGGE